MAGRTGRCVGAPGDQAGEVAARIVHGDKTHEHVCRFNQFGFVPSRPREGTHLCAPLTTLARVFRATSKLEVTLCRWSLVVSSSSLAGVSPVRVAVRRPGCGLAVSWGNLRGRSPVSNALMGERLSGP